MNTENMTIDKMVSNTVERLLALEIRNIEETIGMLISKIDNYPPYMRSKQACEYLSVSENTLAKFIAENGLPVTVIDGVKLISKADMDEFVISHRRD
ncbi:helix-turn-helix domain-containing protein [Vagococcus fluvialis]|uniref:helix-turn-helix domain-containing protein n=1 Tax=Vagococcus fluvialis TaxID=2738 RepID=UPI001A8FC1C4|nr:helix-turn-helix domain-containing protein [Vagococcus fluvialis]MBO0480171.1 helix-turn-helix domain-containing protein [Vagococcus fluvialis]MBO0483936.1 helix-turn-helix domain-containing protein [Vagococcus fluvialis]